jgi:hypothetical protein
MGASYKGRIGDELRGGRDTAGRSMAIGVIVALTAFMAASACSEGSEASQATGSETAGPISGAVDTSIRQVFDTHDINRDGVFTPSESDAFQSATFRAADADADRQITASEWAAFGFGLSSVSSDRERSSAYAAAKEEIHRDFDADRSGGLSWAEFRGGLNASLEKAPGQVDGNSMQMTYDSFRQSPVVSKLATAAGG